MWARACVYTTLKNNLSYQMSKITNAVLILQLEESSFLD